MCLLGIVKVKGLLFPLSLYVLSFISKLGFEEGLFITGASTTCVTYGVSSTTTSSFFFFAII